MFKYTLRYLLVIILISISIIGNGQTVLTPADINNNQNPDLTVNVHSPHKAAMYSALVPGLGQIYNKKYWKLPVIYGLTGVFIYAFDFNNDEYNKFKNAYADMEAGKITSFQGYYSSDVLLRIKDKYRRDRDLNVIVLAAIYMLNIVDATVDAHLFDFEMNQDLSFNLQPEIKKTFDYNYSYGLCLTVSLKSSKNH